MKADGYSLDDKRTEIKENDIPDIIERYREIVATSHCRDGACSVSTGTGTDVETENKLYDRKQQSFLVPKADIVANDYDLSINKYKEVERVKVEYEDPDVVLARLEGLQNQVAEAMAEYKKLG